MTKRYIVYNTNKQAYYKKGNHSLWDAKWLNSPANATLYRTKAAASTSFRNWIKNPDWKPYSNEPLYKYNGLMPNIIIKEVTINVS